MKILLDRNVLVPAAISPDGLAKKILDRIGGNDEHVLVMSSHILSEVADVLSRPRIQARWPLSENDIQNFCPFLSEVAEEVRAQPLNPVIADSKDQSVIEAAVTARADVICTGDAHFMTALCRGISPALAFPC